MWQALFSFSGRIGRLGYFLSLLGLEAAMLVPVVILLDMARHHKVDEPMILMGAGLSVIVALVLMLWSGLSLHARRIRDIGWNPLYVIPGLILFNVMDQVLATGLPALAIGHTAHTLLGVMVNLAYVGVLFFWPSESYDASAPMIGDISPTPDEPLPVQPTAPTRAAPPAPTFAPGPVTFGRRGA